MRYMKAICAIVLGTATVLAGNPVQAMPLFDFSGIAFPAPDGIFAPQPVFPGASDTYGYTFTVSSSIPIDGIGIFDYQGDGLGSTHDLALWRSDDPGTPVVTGMVSSGQSSNSDASVSGEGNYIYVDVYTTLEPLAPNEYYTLGASYGPAFPNQDMIVSMATAIIENAPGAAYVSGAFGIGMSPGIMLPPPIGAEDRYFGPTLRIAGLESTQSAQSVSISEPFTLVLLSIGMLGLGIGRQIHS